MKVTIASLIILVIVAHAQAAEYIPSSNRAPEPVREFRGAWIATVHNHNWPSKPGLSASAQKAEMVQLLNSAASVGVNAVIFQVRTECDALYQSKYEPWSYWLTGQQGKSPGYDPLQFAIQEAHKRGMELHAWFNPFRASASDKSKKVSSHITRTHGSLMLRAGTQTWANPASSQVRQRAIDVMVDVVKRYDVDGVHIDDYFYPYPKKVNGKMQDQFDDSRDYQAYRRNGGKLSVRDWRRNNINSFVQKLYHSVKSTRATVKVGISPFGIWRPGTPRGIEATLDSYDHISADSRKWLREGWLDYLSPQLYWQIDDRPHSFTTLAKWWSSENVKQRHLWPGIASDRILSSEDRNRPASETIRQIEVARTVATNRMGSGHVHWSIGAIKDDRGGLRNQLGRIYASTPLVPASPWLGQGVPENAWVAPKDEGRTVLLQFKPSSGSRWRVVQTRNTSESPWRTLRMIPANQNVFRLNGTPHEIAIRNLSSSGMLSNQTVIRRQ